MILAAVNLVSAIQRFFGAEPEGRRLTPEEIAELEKIFSGAVALKKVRIKEGKIGVMSASGRAFTVGNTIYIPGENGAGYGPAGSRGYMILLAHETTHVWQYQNGGTRYMMASLRAQASSYWRGRNVHEAYDFELGISAGKKWARLNPEQQAELIEQCYANGYFDNGETVFNYCGRDHTKYARSAVTQLRAGKGAP